MPVAHIRFGDYNTTEIAKNNEIYFWTSTSKYNWTVDLIEIQYGSQIYDIAGETKDQGKSLIQYITSLIRTPMWQVDPDDKKFKPTQDNVLKAIINPSSPFIALPQSLFALLKIKFLTSYSELSPHCGDFCLIP